ncbi:MAG: SMI1/KNR4 family protein [Bacteroidota bacterium]
MPFPVELEYIKETEKELGVQFPLKFIRKMSIENGGEVMTDESDWQLIPFFDKSDNKRISRTCNHIIPETEKAREWIGFPSKGITIATNGSGDYLVLLPTEDSSIKLREEIYIWLHETAEIIYAADSIDDLTEEE